jgi:hypothetical protein
MAAAISAADRSLDLVISFSRWHTRYSGYLMTRRAFEPRYSGPRQLIFECGITITRARGCPPTDSVASTTRHFLSEWKLGKAKLIDPGRCDQMSEKGQNAEVPAVSIARPLLSQKRTSGRTE